jgi:transposase-like protein
MNSKTSMNEPVIQTKKSRTKYDKAFKQRAVELWLTSGKAATVVAAELGIRAQLLSAWRERFAPPPPGGGGAPPAGLSNSKPKSPACSARTTICASSGTF